MILITAALMLLTLLDWRLSPVRVLFAIALVTILPGYALTTAIFINTPLGIMEKVAFSFGFSLGITSLGGLLLNYTPWGIQSMSWVVLLGGISIIGNFIAIARMKDESKVDLGVVQVPLQLNQLILMLIGTVILGGVIFFARAGAEKLTVPPTTRLWILWTDDSRTQVKLGVQNEEGVPMQYRLQITTLQGQVQEWSPISLEAGGNWEVQYEPPENVAESDFIKGTLYRLDAPEKSYREVYLRRVVR